MNKSKIVERKLEAGEIFRIAGPQGVSPEIWTWDGVYKDKEKEFGYVCRRLSDGFIRTLYPSDYIVPLDSLDDF